MTQYVQTKYVSPTKPSIQLPVDDLDQVFAYDAGNVSTITVVYQGVTYVQTFTYAGSNVIEISQWTPQ